MIAIDPTQRADIMARHPEAFAAGSWKRYSALIGAAAAILYVVYCWWFFSIGTVLGTANWKLGANYLADWVSYEIRPNIALKPNWLEITYSRFSPLGENPNPDWVIKTDKLIEKLPETPPPQSTGGGVQSSGSSFVAPSQAQAGTAGSVQSSGTSFVAPAMENVGGAAAPTGGTESVSPPEPVSSVETVRAEVDLGRAVLRIEPDLVIVERNGTETRFRVQRGVSVTAEGELPPWAEQRRAGSTVYLTFGWAGRAEIQNDEVVVWKRFFGWKNFFFDTTSKFWGRSFTEVAGLILAGERLDPSRSNASLAAHDFWFNLDWQHGDVWTKLLQTIIMAFVGTVLASLVSFPLAFLAARNITANRPLNQLTKRFFDFQRSVDMLIWALFFTRAFGPGPLAGIAAIFFTDTGTLGKLYAEALENIDDKQRDGVRAVGASPALVQRFGVLPQVLPVFASQALYFWESNTRSATIIGAVGAGGIGLKLWEAMRTNANWANVFYMVLLILIVVYVFDAISSALRHRLIRAPAHG